MSSAHVLSIVESLRLLLAEARTTGSWGDVRGTADALLALGACLPTATFPTTRDAALRWLTSKSLVDEGGRNWEQEVWDTSVAVMALATAGGAHSAEVADGVRWLAAHQDADEGHWNEEPWETLWALLAVHASSATCGWLLPSNRLAKALEWLVGLCGVPPADRLVNWHYTGLFALAVSRYLESDIRGALGESLERRLRAVRMGMLDGIRRRLDAGGPTGALLTKETWSNGLVIWALAENEGVDDGSETARSIASALSRELRRRDLMTEDRAFATIAAFRLEVCRETVRDARVRSVVQRLRASVDDEDLQAAVDPLLGLLESRATEQLQRRLAEEMLLCEHDYVARPPLVTRGIYPSTYTVNLPERLVNIAGILAVTCVVTALTLFADVASGRVRLLLTLVPIGLGVLATIAQVFNIDLSRLLDRTTRGEVEAK